MAEHGQTEPDRMRRMGVLMGFAERQQTRTIPIVFGLVADPIGSGFVASFPQPGGNVTGFVTMQPTMAGKWLELLKEIAPRVARVAMLFNPATAPYAEYWLNPFKAAAAFFTVQAIVAPVHDTSELESVVAAPIGRRSHRWRPATVSLPSIHTVSSLNSAACCPTEMT
jgi:putative tryptophan/tyrosine transport system substrate-binding protein